MRLVGYAYAGRDDDGTAISHQRAELARYAHDHGHELIGVDCEVGDPARPALAAAFGSCIRDDVDGLLVVRPDRLGRRMADVLPMLERLGAVGAEIVIVDDAHAHTCPAFLALLRKLDELEGDV